VGKVHGIIIKLNTLRVPEDKIIRNPHLVPISRGEIPSLMKGNLITNQIIFKIHYTFRHNLSRVNYSVVLKTEYFAFS
jgi:hypothetical protein